MKASNFIKNGLRNTGIFLWIFRTFQIQLFYRATPVAVFELRFSIRKELKNRKLVERLIIFALIGLLHVQIPEPASRWTTTRAFFCHLSLNFIIAKYWKQEVDDGLNVCVDESCPYDLSVTGDIKIYQCHVIKRLWRYYL